MQNRHAPLFHIFFSFIEKSHTVNVFLLTWDSGSELDGIETDNSVHACTHTVEAERSFFNHFFPFSVISCSFCKEQTYHTNEHSVNAYINRFSSKYTFKNINLLKLCVHRVKHFNKLKSCRVWLKILSQVIFTTVFKRIQLTWTKWYQVQLTPAEDWEVLIRFRWIWHTYVLTNTNKKTPQWQSFSTVVRGGWAHLSLFNGSSVLQLEQCHHFKLL